MNKIVDSNGFWTVKNNPITRAGVYPYFGKQISDSLEPDKIYHVLRPLDELTSAETIESFNGVPLINNHEMIGEGFTPYDDRPAGGALFNPQISENGLNGDLRIYSEKIKNAIENGKKELSLGYLCDYELTSGVFDGKKYDAIQRHIRGNHIALVNKGRMGSNVRVYDHSITMDSMDLGLDAMDYDDNHPRDEKGKLTDSGSSNKEDDLTPKKRKNFIELYGEEFLNALEHLKRIKCVRHRDKYEPEKDQIKYLFDNELKEEIPSQGGSPKESGVGSFSQYGEDEMADKREAIRKIMAIAAKSDSDFKGGEEEKIDTIAKLLEGSEYSKSERSEADDKAAKDKKCKDEDDNKPSQEEKKDDKTKTKQEETKDAKKGMDEMTKEIMAQIAARDALVKEVEPLVGSFACDSMSVEEVAAYACDKLGLKADGCDSRSLIKGYIAAQGAKRVFGLDNAIEQNGVDKATEKYLMGD